MTNKQFLTDTQKDRDKRYMLLVYHIMMAYRMPIKLKSKKAKGIKYRYKCEPFRRVLEPKVIDRLDKVDTAVFKNKEWYNVFINTCKMNYAFL